jgi:nucleotide-binding universal stress UspA family protein
MPDTRRRYTVKEIFYTLQGEGAHSGRAAVFCRFAGCNLWTGLEKDRGNAVCRFCDTDFVGTDGENGGEFETPEGLATAVWAVWGCANGEGSTPYVVLTGGEPMLQLDDALIEAALFETGRPVLITPYAGKFNSVGTRALIGWNASPQAARAVHDALPLLTHASSVTVLVIDAATGEAVHGEEPGADIAKLLARHGLEVTLHRVAGGGLSPGDVLLNEAAELNADLIVMGGYGHSRLREMVLGGATRTLLRQMTAPVLMSH